jgi:hypothetical protein
MRKRPTNILCAIIHTVQFALHGEAHISKAVVANAGIRYEANEWTLFPEQEFDDCSEIWLLVSFQVLHSGKMHFFQEAFGVQELVRWANGMRGRVADPLRQQARREEIMNHAREMHGAIMEAINFRLKREQA